MNQMIFDHLLEKNKERMSSSWSAWLETSQSPSQWKTLRERIATRAYFLSQWANRSQTSSDVDIWLEAERIELEAQPRVDCVFDDEYDGWDQLEYVF